MKPVIVLEDAGVVLRDAFTAAAAIRKGDALQAIGPRSCAPATQPTDSTIGLAARSANIGDAVDVVIAGIWETIAAGPITGGQDLAPTARGRARAAQGGRRHCTALDDQDVPGRAVRVLVRPS